MIGRSPNQIWNSGLEEGHRRLFRSPLALAATGLVGGLDVMLGVLALVVSQGALSQVVPEQTAHIAASATFGIAFVFIAIGRSELFTENFLIPVSATLARRASTIRLARMWLVTMASNIVALVTISALISVPGVIDHAALVAAGKVADVYTSRDVFAALLSAVVAGAVMTLFTWLALASESPATRTLVALVAGFLLAAPSLNHAIVSFGEVVLGVVSGTSHGGVDDLVRNLGIAIVGNLIGGLGLVTLTRFFQARGEPAEEASR
jgi:formate/nitrite transporter FocA (FNT family)